MLALMISAVTVTGAAFAAEPVSEDELAQMRGGFTVPGGLEIAMTVQTDTKVDGNLVLRTVFSVTDGPATLAAYAPAPGAITSSRTDADKTDISRPGLNVMFDRSNGFRFANSSSGVPGVSVTTSGIGNIGTGPEGTQMVSAERDGPAVAVPAGSLAIRSLGNGGARISLEGDAIAISHLVGAAFGSVIANNANDRMIDSATTVGLDISGATVANLGSALLRIDTLGIDAASQMMPR